jgi:hypothetical protein
MADNGGGTAPNGFTLWPWWGSRPNRPSWASRTMWDAPQGRWWTGISRRDEWELEK